MREKKLGIFGILPACLLGIASPLCMYGTIPLAALKIVLGTRNFLIYLGFVMAFSLAAGLVVNMVI